jgi:hypothetical protein
MFMLDDLIVDILTGLPKSQILELSYYTTHLILAIRAIENPRNGPMTTPLDGVDLQTPEESSRVSQHRKTHYEKSTSPSKQSMGLGSDDPSRSRRQVPEEIVCKYAILMIETFINLSSALKAEVMDYHHTCIAYSTLAMIHYRDDCKIPTDAVVDLLVSVEVASQECDSTPPSLGIAARLARQKLEDRHTSSEDRDFTEKPGRTVSPGRDRINSDLDSGIRGSTIIAENDAEKASQSADMTDLNDFGDHLEGLQDFDPFSALPTMEDFFVSGFQASEFYQFG